MKIVTVLISFWFGTITCANIVAYQDQRFNLNPDAILEQALDMLKWLIKNGSPDMFPVLDPMMLQDRSFEMSIPNKLLTINANFTNGILRGLGDYEVVKVEFIKTEIAVYISINFPQLILTADQYEMEGDIFEAIPLTGFGTFEFEMTNFNLSSKIYLKQSEDGESVIIDKFQDSQYTIEKITSHTEFDKNIDDIFNALIGDLLAYNLSRFSKYILMKYSDAALETLNPYLNQFETWKFISAIL